MNAYTKNLDLMCRREKSVSKICRSIGINRQQFSRYLSGENTPSQYNQEKISEYFGISSEQFFLPHQTFHDAYSKSSQKGQHTKKANGQFNDLIDNTLSGDSRTLRTYLGFYHAYYYSFAWKGFITRSLVSLYESKGRIYSRTTERMSDPFDGQKYVVKYRGVVTMLADRIYIAETDRLQNEDVNLTILYRSYRSHVSLLSGLTTGCSSRSERDPCSSRVIYEFIGKTADYRVALNKCGLFKSDCTTIPARIKKSLSNESSTPGTLLIGKRVN